MKSKLILYLWCMCTFSACTSSGKGGKEETLYSGEIRIAVDESFKPIMEEELQVYHALTPEALITPIYCSEVEAVNLLLKDSVRLAVTNRRLTEEELISFHTRKFFPESILMALSGVALITPRKLDSNLCESLCSILPFFLSSGVISPSSIISWQPLQTPSDNVSSRA